MTKKDTQSFNFEDSMKELEAIVSNMEHGEFNLEESIKQFEHGVSLTKKCQKALQEAEQKVSQLSSNENDGELTPFTMQSNTE
jgi:exodeoxyribonuclease VII small subunit